MITPALPKTALLLALSLCTATALAAGAPPQAWASVETSLANPVQLTRPEQFIKAGESYFSTQQGDDTIVFQATLNPTYGLEAGAQAPEADPFYAMYTARLTSGVAGWLLTSLHRISPEGSANTCGWFHPKEPKIIFGSTLTRPADDEKSGFRVGTRRYVWQFPKEMEIVSVSTIPDFQDEKPETISNMPERMIERAMSGPQTVFSRELYDAECSYDSTGRFILYTHVVPTAEGERIDGNIAVFDTVTQQHHELITAKGYDGGPFFSSDDTWICFRSDREGNDQLQLFVAKLRFEVDASGTPVPVGIEREFQITNNSHVNWAPFWHPSNQYIVYGSSEAGHNNYELFAIEVPRDELLAGRDPKTLRNKRLTFAPGADILPAFNRDGTKLMWTSQRGGTIEGQERPTSQLWLADWTGVDFATPAAEMPASAPVKRNTEKIEAK
jgi:TolB protein